MAAQDYPALRANSEEEEESQEESPSFLAQGSASAGSASKNKRGSNGRAETYTHSEHLLASKAWVLASLDSKRGSKQKNSEFEAKLEKRYNDLRRDQEKEDAKQRQSNERIGLVRAGKSSQPVVVSYPFRTGSSVHQQFKKKIAPAVMKWQSILKVTSDNEPEYESGENFTKWMERMHLLFETKHGTSFDYVSCWMFLRHQPKWGEYVEEQTSNQAKKKDKMKRPVGSKKTKKQEEEDALIDKVLKKAGANNSDDNSNVVDMTGDNSVNGNGSAQKKADVFSDLSGSLKQFVEMGSQFMMSAMMGISSENTESYVSDEQKREFASMQMRMQLAKMEEQAIALEESNQLRRKNLSKHSDSDDHSKES